MKRGCAARPQTLWTWGYVLWALAAASLGAARYWWAWPNAAWQTNLLFIEDIDRLLDGDLAHVTWFVTGQQHALNGFRWYEYFSAAFLGFDSRIENVVYYAIVLALSLLIGLRILRRLGTAYGVWPRVALFILPLAFANLAGGGSHGMELGTFTGILLSVSLFLLLHSALKLRWYVLVVSVVVPVAVFAFLGGYSSGPTLALVIIWGLQFLRPTLTPESRNRVRLSLLTATFVVWTGLYFVLIRIFNPASTEASLPTLVNALASDPAFPLKYLFWGPPDAVMSSQTIEALGSRGLVLAALASILLMLLTVLGVALSARAGWRESTVPLLLILYPWGIALTLLATRNSDVTYLLTPWYSLHFKVGLAGILWLAILALRSGPTARVATRVVISGLLAVLVGLIVVANGLQYNRQVFERQYYLNVARVELLPYELVNTPGVNTPIQVSYEESVKSIAILKKHSLSVYRDPDSTWAEIYGYVPAFVTSGDYTTDGWAGRHLSILVLDDACETLTVKISSIEPSEDIEYTLDIGAEHVQQGVLGEVPTELTIHPAQTPGVIQLGFSQTFTPLELGMGPDLRELAAAVQPSCSP